MACYFQYLKGVFREATVEVTQENVQDLAEFLADLVRLRGSDCPDVWRALRPWVEDLRMRSIVVQALRDEFGTQ